jgi:hypothetical protein
MALGSLASTTKISGINTMTTTKPVFQKISSSALFDVDDWTVENNSKLEKPKEYLEFNTPPLALILAMFEAGKAGHEIHGTLVGLGKRPHIVADTVVSIEHQKQAANIYKHFQQKYTMRRIKGEYISKFMLAVDELCENRKKIDLEHLKVLVTLPRFYEQNCAVEHIMKSHKSYPVTRENLNFDPIDCVVDFVGQVEAKANGKTEVHYFFSTPKNYLVRIVVKKGEYGETAWNTLSKLGKLRFTSDITFSFNIKGYDFNVIQTTPNMQVTIVELDK